MIRTPSYEELERLAMCASLLARGMLVLSHPLGILARNLCETTDEDSDKLSVVDTIVSSGEGLKCYLLYPRALASCIPRGFEALVVTRWKWQAKLAVAALAHAGYKRIHVTGRTVDIDVLSLEHLYKVNIDIVSMDTARYYLDSSDLIIDVDVWWDEAPPKKTIHVSWEEVTDETACILSWWLSNAILLWENIFVDHREARAIISSLPGNREQHQGGQQEPPKGI